MAVTTIEKSYYVSLWEDAEDGTSDHPPHSVYMLETSPINQMGKTTFSLVSAEVVLEQLHGRKMDPDNIHFEVPAFMERRETIREWDQQVLDEPQRPAGNRKWQTPENQVLAEALLTSNYWHKHVHLPTPHVHLVDSQIYGVATSHTVITSLGHATVYSLRRDQLNRSFPTKTPKLCTITFDKPSAWLWHQYCKKRDDFTSKRLKHQREVVQAMHKDYDKVPSSLSPDELVPLIMEDPEKYMQHPGKISPGLVEDHFKVPFNRAQAAARRATKALRAEKDLESAEKDS